MRYTCVIPMRTKQFMSRNSLHTAAILGVLLAVFMAIEYWMGRIPVCTCGFGVLTTDAWSSETSQLFADPYSSSHILHGIIFYAILRWLTPRLSVGNRLIIATLLEIAWELLENSPIIINRYRAATASLDYYGDSILNSFGDVSFVLLGFWIAHRLPWKRTLAFCIVVELVMLAVYRDNLTLNVLMLAYPVQAIKEWQVLH